MSERRPRSQRVNFHAPSIVYLWVLRILVTLGAQREFITEHVFTNDGLASVLGLNQGPYSAKHARARLKRIHNAAERAAADTQAPARLALNVRRLRELVALSDCDCRILEFAVLIHTERVLDDTADMLGILSSNKVHDVLAALLDLPASQVRASLGPQGILARAGLVSLSRSGGGLLRTKLDLLSENFADALAASYADPLTLLRGVVDPVSPAELTLKDFEHITSVLKVLRPYLQHSLAERRKGVNAFLHGPPGTGKSQFVRALALALECDLFEVSAEDGDGDPISGERRLRAFRAAQTFFARRRALILFDEVEDVFNDGHAVFGQKSTAQTHKAWINRSLEENAVPTLWVSNTAEGIDAAFLRRFDLIFELAVPPRRQRERILAAACSDLLSAGEIGRLAASDALAPAVATRAASIVRSIRAELPDEEVPKAFDLIVGNTLRAQGHPGLSSDANRLPELYEPALVNADVNLAELAAGLVQARSGRLCLYGPPGTGKTAFGRWVAEQMNVPLLTRRASDLLSMWVGGSERNIARAFREAADAGSVLLIDEMDSFLPDRRGAQRSWEVTLVNEVLTQMESFAGVFIASTNLMDNLDQAALRRFDLKIKFDYMKPDQAVELLGRYASTLALPSPDEGVLSRLRQLRALTPGDFAAVARQNRLRSLSSCAGLVAALEAECSLKDGPKRPIGFHQ